MKPNLIAAASVLALIAVPALADNGQTLRNPQANYQSDYRVAERMLSQCFNGKTITGMNRAGATTLLVQASTGAIYELTIPRGCPNLDRADKVAISAAGGAAVCAGQDADISVRTASGPKRCYVSAVRQLPPVEARALAEATTR